MKDWEWKLAFAIEGFLAGAMVTMLVIKYGT